MDEFEQELRRDIEKFWRDRFADEIDSCMMAGVENDEATRWFNAGMEHASKIVRYSRDN